MSTWTDWFAIFCALACAVLVYRELSPNTRMSYSKFTNKQKPGETIPSQDGMMLIYGPSLFVCIFLLFYAVNFECLRMILIASTSFLHYLKRYLEVLHLHKYSGESNLKDDLSISVCYLSYVFMVYFFSSSVEYAYDDFFCLGLLMFFAGEYINFYHHRILSSLRKDGSKTYKIPYGGLFEYCWCPHYLGEITTFIAISLMSQHNVVVIMQLGSIAYLTVRAYNTKLWYQSKFKTIPERYCIFPGIF